MNITGNQYIDDELWRIIHRNQYKIVILQFRRMYYPIRHYQYWGHRCIDYKLSVWHCKHRHIDVIDHIPTDLEFLLEIAEDDDEEYYIGKIKKRVVKGCSSNAVMLCYNNARIYSR